MIQCADHYLAAHPNGYWEGAKLNEAEFGAALWSAAEVNFRNLVSGLQTCGCCSLFLVGIKPLRYVVLRYAGLQSRKKLTSGKPSFDLDTPSTSASEEDVELGKSDKGFKMTDIAPKERYGASYVAQYQILLRRALKVRRFEALSLQDIVQFVVVSILAGNFNASLLQILLGSKKICREIHITVAMHMGNA